MRLNVGDPDKRAPHAQGNFKTPSGKCEFKAGAAENGNFVVPVWRSMYEAMQPGEPVDPLPDYMPPYETPHSNPALAKRYPLNLISPKPHAFLNTQYANEALQQRRQGEQTLLIHPKDAAARGIRNGSYVHVFNDRGSVQALAELTDDVMPGLVLTSVGYWPSLNRGGTSVNATSPEKHCSLGQAGTFSDNLVEVAGGLIRCRRCSPLAARAGRRASRLRKKSEAMVREATIDRGRLHYELLPRRDAVGRNQSCGSLSRSSAAWGAVARFLKRPTCKLRHFCDKRSAVGATDHRPNSIDIIVPLAARLPALEIEQCPSKRALDARLVAG